MNFSENLIKLRKGKGWSQEDLADKLNISRQAVSKWEVGSSKPDIDNIIKLSKLFNITIDELVNNQITETEAISIKVKKETKAKKALIWLRRIMIALVIIYVVNTIYKFSLLLAITSAEKKYQELNNYHYVITKYDEEGLKEKEECWFKDGVSKTVSIIYDQKQLNQTVICVDYNTKNGYTVNGEKVSKLDVNNYINASKNYEKGGQLYSTFPLSIRIDSMYKLIKKVISLQKSDIYLLNNNIFIYLNNSYVNLNKKDLKPLTYYYEENSTGKFITAYYNIELNCVENVHI